MVSNATAYMVAVSHGIASSLMALAADIDHYHAMDCGDPQGEFDAIVADLLNGRGQYYLDWLRAQDREALDALGKEVTMLASQLEESIQGYFWMNAA